MTTPPNTMPVHVYHHTPPTTCTTDQHACLVPLSPEAIQVLQGEYDSLVSSHDPSVAHKTFPEWLSDWRAKARAPARHQIGLDDGRAGITVPPGGDMHKIDRPPSGGLKGVVHTLVLLVDFPDKPHDPQFTTQHYEDLLFNEGNDGSMRRYYQDISGFSSGGKNGGNGGIDIQGKVYGWYTMPQPISYYAGGSYGYGNYPNNSQKLAEDAVKAALAANVPIGHEYDAYNEGAVTAVFIVHAGRGAEQTSQSSDLWSLKWGINPITVSPGLTVGTFLVVPEDCYVGVCAHEWGHLAARWADYYDTGNTQVSSGLGMYCLMAAGSWGNNGKTPVYPNSMLRMFHDWQEIVDITTTQTVSIRAVSDGGKALYVRNPKKMRGVGQYIIVEYRRQLGRDKFLTDQGVAIYVVDESIPDVDNENKLAIELMQADGRRDLANWHKRNVGDASDLYPHGSEDTIGKNSSPPLNLPNGTWSGVTIKVHGQPGDEEVKVEVTIG